MEVPVAASRYLIVQSRMAAGDASVAPVLQPEVQVAVDAPILSRRIAAALATEALSAGPAGATPRSGQVVILAHDLSAPGRVSELKELLATSAALGAVVVVTPRAGGPRVGTALRAGASGLVLEAELERTLAPAVRAVAAGLRVVPCTAECSFDKPSFSSREREVLRLIVAGLTNGEIAAKLFLAESTVKSHISSSLRKLGVRSRSEATRLLLDPDEGLAPLVFGTQHPAAAPAPPEHAPPRLASVS